MADRPLWTGQSNPDSTVPPTLQQMFALAQKMGYEMRPIARRLDLRERPSPLVKDTVHHSGPVVTFLGSSASVAVNSDIFRLVARIWNMQSDNQQHQNIAPPQGNSI